MPRYLALSLRSRSSPEAYSELAEAVQKSPFRIGFKHVHSKLNYLLTLDAE